MTVTEAAALRDELVKGFKSYDGVIIDLDAVSECDVAAVQLLCSARLTAENMGKSFRVSGASMASMDAIARAGLNPDTILGSILF